MAPPPTLLSIAFIAVSLLYSPVDTTEQIPALVTYPEIPTEKIILNDNHYEVTECTADGSPRPTFQWFRDGVKIEGEGNATTAFSNGTLVLKEFTAVENGYFQCKASNKYGTSLSEIMHIVAQVKSAGKEITTKLTVTEGSPYSLPCDNVKPTVPRAEKRWYRDRKMQLPIDNRRGVDTDGTLHFAYTDRTVDSSQYICGLVPEVGHRISIDLFTRGELEVKEHTGPSLTSVRPKLTFSKKTVKAIVGHTAVLECFFASKPPATVTWKNSSNHVVKVKAGNPRFTVSDFGRKLIINEVQQQDEGTFSCTGKNTYGSLEARINVNVTSPPWAIPGGALKSQTVPDKSDLTLFCKTKSAVDESLETPRWYRNGKFLTQNNVPDPSRYRFSSDYTKLRINGLNKQADTACFQCNSSNSEGYEFFDASIRVINSIEITKQPAAEAVIEHGDVVDITIQAKGDDCCKINMLWYFNGTLINEPDKWLPFQKDPYSNELLFNSSLVSQDSLISYVGDYRCRVSNPYQPIDVKFAIRLKGQMEPATASASIGLWWVGLLCGVLAIIIAIIVVVVLYKSNYPRSTYKLEKQEIKHNLNPEEELLNKAFPEI